MRLLKMLSNIKVLLVTVALPSFAMAQSQCDLSPELKSQVLEGFITREDFETYIELPFEVAEGTKSISVHFSYDRKERTTVDLGLLDTHGFRGWSGGNKSNFIITQNFATPSYNAGPIDAGTWYVLLGVPNIREGQRAGYEVNIELECELLPETSPIPSDRGQDWYVGDLHMHTGHSDGSCDSLSGQVVPCPAYLSLEAAAKEELDFISITEHNAVSQLASRLEYQRYFDSVLLMPGREVTTFYGHANVFGSSEFIDFRLQAGSAKNAGYLHDQVELLGGLLSINHPGSPSGEDCMGCGWVLTDTDYSKVEAMEIVNVGYVDLPRGKAHIDFWQQKLNEGYRITGIGGSDNHRATRPISQPSAIGNPRTWIFAENLSVQSILEGIRAGNVYVDASGGSVRLDDFRIGEAEMGDEILLSNTDLAVSLSWQSTEDLHVQFIHQGRELEVSANSQSDSEFTGKIDPISLTTPGWIRINLVDGNGAIRLLGNPVFLNRN